MTLRIIPRLEREPTLQRLRVRDTGLGVNPAPPRSRRRAANVGVPGAKVAVHRQRHLGAPADACVESRAEPLEKRQLRVIADGVASRVRSYREIEADDSEPASQLLERNPAEFTALESHQLLVRSACRLCHVAQAQTSADSGEPMLLTRTPHRFSGASATTIGGSLSSSHGSDLGARGFTANCARSSRVWSASRTNGRSGRRVGHRKLGSVVIWSGSRTKQRRNGPVEPSRHEPTVGWSASRTTWALARRTARVAGSRVPAECEPRP